MRSEWLRRFFSFELPEEGVTCAWMFLDVKGFTTYSETHSSSEVVFEFNRIFCPATALIYEHGGDIDKYIGDCIFAVFPTAEKAVQSAKKILQIVARELDTPFQIRIGVHMGRAIRANVGGDGKREYTYIGDEINLAQRLESNCTPSRILISDAVYENCSRPFSCLEKKVIMVKGRQEPVVVYECWDLEQI